MAKAKTPVEKLSEVELLRLRQAMKEKSAADLALANAAVQFANATAAHNQISDELTKRYALTAQDAVGEGGVILRGGK